MTTEYLQNGAQQFVSFILKDLQAHCRITTTEICFSYSPLDDTQIFNASLLAAETLASVGDADW